VSAALIACASELRFAPGVGAAPLVRLAGDAGFDGIALGGACGLGDVAHLVSASLAAGLTVPVVAAPLAEGPLSAGRRLPYLASLGDSDERRAAVAAFKATLDAAGTFGVRLLAVTLGEAPLHTGPAGIARRFARRELDEGEPGSPAWKAVVAQRRALSGLVVDACRYALDRVLPAAEARDTLVVIELAADPWGIPGPKEALALMDEYRNGPIGVVWDEARMQALTALGLGPSVERATALGVAARIWRANEAVGLELGYLPGLGDVGGAFEPGGELSPWASVPAGVPIVVTGRTDSSAAEVARARELVAGRSGA